jgi:hypothetical protein
LDSAGVYGAVLQFTLVAALVGSAFLVFLYLWYKNRLDMDEEPKFRMMSLTEKESIEEK